MPKDPQWHRKGQVRRFRRGGQDPAARIRARNPRPPRVCAPARRMRKDCHAPRHQQPGYGTGFVPPVLSGQVIYRGYGWPPARRCSPCAWGDLRRLLAALLLKYFHVSLKGRRKLRSQSVQAHTALHQRPPVSSHSGPIAEGRQPFLQTSTSAHELAQRLPSSRLSLHNSETSVFSQSPAVAAAGQLTVQEQAAAMLRSSLASSTSSTLSLLFGKRSFSSALVISGLSAADGGNTSDTQSSSSVNIAMGPSARAASQAARVSTDPELPGSVGVCTLLPFWPLTAQRRVTPPLKRSQASGACSGLGLMPGHHFNSPSPAEPVTLRPPGRRASQEDMALDDTASQQSLSEEQ
ncbi:PREDICTED: pecanex-like protein 2 [Tinamus guttatus]|uniref:pecanex-like protein 2 n=1 Tax=Tinamus guttatus TaxID=94827 RepID=UPI00052E8D1E|nr:PREDICTED: pecanex-like protein 2 [Tinamus guttatus]